MLKDMRIGELADSTGTSPRSLRYYEQQGLLNPQRADNGYRVYDRLDAVRVANIKSLLDAGLTLDEVRPAFEKGCLDVPLPQSSYCAEALDRANERLATLDDRIAALQDLRSRLATHIEAEATRPPEHGEN